MLLLDLAPLDALPLPVKLILRGWVRGLASSEHAAELLAQYDIDRDKAQQLFAMTAWAQPGPCGCMGTA